MPVEIAKIDGEPVYARTIGEIYDELGKQIKAHGSELPCLIRLVPPPRVDEETGEEKFFPDDELVVVSLDVTYFDAVPNEDPELFEPEHVGISAAIPDDFLIESDDENEDGEDNESDD